MYESLCECVHVPVCADLQTSCDCGARGSASGSNTGLAVQGWFPLQKQNKNKNVAHIFFLHESVSARVNHVLGYVRACPYSPRGDGE